MTFSFDIVVVLLMSELPVSISIAKSKGFLKHLAGVRVSNLGCIVIMLELMLGLVVP